MNEQKIKLINKHIKDPHFDSFAENPDASLSQSKYCAYFRYEFLRIFYIEAKMEQVMT